MMQRIDAAAGAPAAAGLSPSRVAERVQALLHERFSLEREQLSRERPLDELGIDSLAAIEFLFDLEQEFQITLADDRAPLRTVGDLATLIERELALKAAGA